MIETLARGLGYLTLSVAALVLTGYLLYWGYNGISFLVTLLRINSRRHGR